MVRDDMITSSLAKGKAGRLSRQSVASYNDEELLQPADDHLICTWSEGDERVPKPALDAGYFASRFPRSGHLGTSRFQNVQPDGWEPMVKARYGKSQHVVAT
jgi:hypothetical protein